MLNDNEEEGNYVNKQGLTLLDLLLVVGPRSEPGNVRLTCERKSQRDCSELSAADCSN